MKRILLYALVCALTFCIAVFFCGCDNDDAPAATEYSYHYIETNFTVNEDDVYAKIYIPDSDSAKMPAVILSHSANLTADSMNSYASGFAKRGYVALAFDFRGGSANSRSDGDIKNMTLFTECDDLKGAIKTAAALEYVDEDRIFLFGTSQGGLITALTAEEVENVKGQILLYPAFNIPELVSKFSGFSDFTDLFGSFSFGTYGKDFMNTLKGFDVYEHIGGFDGNVLIIHGSKDFIVNKSYSERAAEEYENCALKIIEGAGHGFNEENYSMGGDFDEQVWAYIDEYLNAQ